MPLFTSRFYGLSDTGARVFASVGTEGWYVLTEPRSGDPRLLFALAFIHNRAWNNG